MLSPYASTYLSFLLLTSHDHQLGRGMHDFQFLENGGGIVGEEHLLQMIDDHLVVPARSERRLHR